jgi:hypothetical protein
MVEDRWATTGVIEWLGTGAGGVMEGIYFLIFWIGSALLHTLYDLKVKPYLDTFWRDTGNWPFS